MARRSLSSLIFSYSTTKSKTTPFSTLRYQSTLSSSEEETEAHIRRLEDAIHHLIVRRSAPDWLPFIPGSSYWVPPSSSTSLGIAHLVDKLANPLSPDESLSTTTVRGWPSSTYFLQGSSPSTEVKVTLVNMDEEIPSSNPLKSEDKED